MDWLSQLLAILLLPIYAVAVLIGLTVLGIGILSAVALIETIQDHRDGHGSA